MKNKKKELLREFNDLVIKCAKTYSLNLTHKNIVVINTKKNTSITNLDSIDLCFMAITHGNETIGLYMFIEFLSYLNKFKPSLSFSIALLLGNEKAFLEDKRYIETDLNRSFAIDSTTSYEIERAKDLSLYLKKAKYFIDFHQTIQETLSPFFIFPYSLGGLELARHLNPYIPVVTHWQGGFSKDGKCSDEFVNASGGIGISVETGKKGFCPLQLGLGLNLMLRACEFVSSLKEKKPLRSMQEIGRSFEDIYTWAQIFRKDHKESFVLDPGWKNFMDIKEGQRVGLMGSQEILASNSGKMLFPKYVDSSSHISFSELFRVIKRVNPHELPK